MFKRISSTKVQIFKRKRSNVWFYWDSSKGQMTQRGEPNILQNINPGQTRFIFWFTLEKQLNPKPYPMPKINEMLLKLECFKYATSIYLNMRYYNIQLTEDTYNLCMTIFLWGKYHCKRFPMRVSKSPDIPQQKMNDLFQGFQFIYVYLNKMLMWT